MPIIIILDIIIIIIIIVYYGQYLGVVVLKGDGDEYHQCSRIQNGKRIISFFFSFQHLLSLLLSLHLINPLLKRQRKNKFFYLFSFLDPTTGGVLLNSTYCTGFFFMGTKMKGICKGFNNFFSQIFVVKEREIEIGYPTDVKHVAHIGWDGAAGTAPSWMNEFKTGPDFAATSIGNSGSALSPWSSQDFDAMGHQSTASMCKAISSSDLPNIPKPKQRRKKSKSTSSPRSNSSSTSKTSRAAKSKAKFVEGNAKPANIEVA